MTNQEAIKRLSTIFVHCDVDQCEDYSCDDCNETVRMAIEALKEQSPCDMCENGDCWEVCQFCPAEPKGSDDE